MAKLRVKLITMPWELEVPTLSLASLAAVTPKQWFDVCIVDAIRERIVLDEPVDLVGISASTPQINAAYALADYYRKKGARVVIGGHHVTALPQEGLEHADAVVQGEGEGSWMQICDQMLTNPKSVSGIYNEAVPDLASLPLPRIDLMKLKRYQPYYYPVIASRGCPELCSFCFAKRMTRGYRTHPISYVIDQIRARPSWIKAMYFVDDNLAGDIDYTRELFKELKKFQVPFGMQVRHEFSQDPENLRMARDAGCMLVSSGYESVNQNSLDKTGKHANAALYKQIISNIQNEGMMASGNWMFGFDWDTPDIFEETWEFLRDSEILHSSFTVEIPYPGTPGYRTYEKQGRILTTDYDQYTGKDSVVHQPKQMSAQELRRGIRWLTRKYYSVQHRNHLAKVSRKNIKLWSDFSPIKRWLGITFMNYYQVYLWQYRMTPSLQWLYSKTLPFNKYRHVSDWVRRSNFWRQSYQPVLDGASVRGGASPFLLQAGNMPPGKTKLRPVAQGNVSPPS